MNSCMIPVRSICFSAAFAILALPASAATLIVTSAGDDAADPATLRGAIAAAADGDTITFDASLAGATIALDKTLATLKKKYDLDHAPVQLYKSSNQILNFVECIESRKPTISPAEVGGRGAILCQLCNMSYVYDTGFDWDPVKMDFANGTGKGISLKRDFCRNGWEVVV